MLDLQRLRQEAYTAWKWLQGSQTDFYQVCQASVLVGDGNQLPYTDTSFKEEIRHLYGDLRCRETWEKAAINLTARRVSEYYLEPHQIVGYLASSEYLNCTIRRHYGERLIDAMLQIPEVLEMLQDGLEHLFHVSRHASDREIALKFVKKIAHRLWPNSVQ